MNNSQPRFRRVLLKLSGEALMGDKSFGIDPEILQTVAGEISELHQLGIEIAVVIGGGNIFRGLNSSKYGIGRVPADHMGMLATVINAIALGEALNHLGSEARVMSAIDMNKITEPYIRERAVSHLKKKTHRPFWCRNRQSLFQYGYRRRSQGHGNRFRSPVKGHESGWCL